MKWYGLKLFLFSVPLIILFAFPLWVQLMGREFYPTEKVIEIQEQPLKVLFGLGYTNVDQIFKIVAVSQRRPQVIALGSSRVMQFREFFFKPTASFFNAGGAIRNTQDFPQFMDYVAENKNLQVFIVGIDPHFLNPERSMAAQTKKDSLLSRLHEFFLYGWKRVYKDYYAKKFSLTVLMRQHKETENIGLNALVNGVGFRNDGSYSYGNTHTQPDTMENLQKDIQRVLDSIKPNKGGYGEYGSNLSVEKMEHIEKFLRLSRKRNIYVIGFIPPYAHAIYEKMRSLPLDDPHRTSIEELPKKLQSLFATYKYPLFDFEDITKVGSSDAELIDAWHGSEKTYLKILLYMAKDDKILSQYVDTKSLKNLLYIYGDNLSYNP